MALKLVLILAASAAFASAPTPKMEVSGRVGKVVNTIDGRLAGSSDWKAVGGMICSTGQWAELSFMPGIACRVAGFEVVAKTDRVGGFQVPVALAIPNPDYTITTGNYRTASTTNWFEEVSPAAFNDSVFLDFDPSLIQRNSVSNQWAHYVFAYDAAVSSCQWRVWRNGVEIGRRTSTRNTATKWNPDGLCRFSFFNGFSVDSLLQIAYFRPFIAVREMRPDDVYRMWAEWQARKVYYP
jgi:hypothetical protein